MVATTGPAPARTAKPEELNPDDYMTFWEFFKAWIILQEIQLPLKWFHKVICDTLQDAFLGVLPENIEIVIINMPPRTGKTKILEAWACWSYGYFPESQFIFTSYAASLVKLSIAYIGDIMMCPWYAHAFSDFLHTKSALKVTTTRGGNLHGEGTGGSLTGKGGGLKRPAGGAIVLDDPEQPEEALSLVESEKKKRWLATTLISRRNSSKYCPIVLCQQRTGPEDMTAYALATFKGKCIHLKFPALVNDVSQIPETITTDKLLAMKGTRYFRYVLASQYQQEPIALGGNLIMVEKFGRWDATTARNFEWEELIITCDTALKAKESSDYSCAQLWGKKDQRVYLIDQIHGKWESPQLLANCITFSNKCRGDFEGQALRFIVEEKAAGPGLIQQMLLAGIPCEGIERDIDKVRRVQAIMPYQEAGLVFIPFEGSTPWVDGFVTECAQFKPDETHAYDDQVDCLCDGVTLLLGRSLSILDVLGMTGKQ